MKYMYLVMKDINVHGDFNDVIHASEPYLLFQSKDSAEDFLKHQQSKSVDKNLKSFFINKIKVEDMK